MITLTGSTKPQPMPEAEARAVSTAERRSNAEMARLRELILGETTDRVEDISRQVTSRDARVRRLVEDMPDALTKNSVDQGSLTRLANALRVPIEEALNQSVRGDQQKLADILAPALARALPRTLMAFIVGLPTALARRVCRVICPWIGRSSTASSALGTLAGQPRADHPFQVDRICLFKKGTIEVLRSADVGFDEDASLLEVDHLFLQLADALREGSTNPTALLRFPRSKAKNEAQGMILIEGEHTILAAYHKGQPAPWLRDRLQDLADEADGQAKATLDESAAGQDVEHRLQSLDSLLTKGLVCYVPVAQTTPAAKTGGRSSWLEDAAVITCVIGVVWLVASVSRASTLWNKVVQDLDSEAGIVVTDRSWIPGRSITGLRDPLAPDPSDLLKSHGFAPDSMKLHFTSFLSDEAPFKEQRESLQHAERDSVRREISSSYARALALMEASLEMHSAPAASASAPGQSNGTREVIRKELLRTLLELPPETNFEFKDGTVTIPASLPKATRSRIREVIKAVPWVKQVMELDIPAKSNSALPTGGTGMAEGAMQPALAK